MTLKEKISKSKIIPAALLAICLLFLSATNVRDIGVENYDHMLSEVSFLSSSYIDLTTENQNLREALETTQKAYNWTVEQNLIFFS